MLRNFKEPKDIRILFVGCLSSSVVAPSFNKKVVWGCQEVSKARIGKCFGFCGDCKFNLVPVLLSRATYFYTKWACCLNRSGDTKCLLGSSESKYYLCYKGGWDYQQHRLLQIMNIIWFGLQKSQAKLISNCHCLIIWVCRLTGWRLRASCSCHHCLILAFLSCDSHTNPPTFLPTVLLEFIHIYNNV